MADADDVYVWVRSLARSSRRVIVKVCSVEPHLDGMTALHCCSEAAVLPQAAKVPLNEYEFPSNKVANVQSQLEKLVEKNYYLHQSARDAYRYAALLLPPSTLGHSQKQSCIAKTCVCIWRSNTIVALIRCIS